MIRVEVEDYCQTCQDFIADVVSAQKYYSGKEEVMLTDTVVRCGHRRRCSAIARYLESKLKGEEK